MSETTVESAEEFEGRIVFLYMMYVGQGDPTPFILEMIRERDAAVRRAALEEAAHICVERAEANEDFNHDRASEALGIHEAIWALAQRQAAEGAGR